MSRLNSLVIHMKFKHSAYLSPLIILIVWGLWYLYTAPRTAGILLEYWEISLTMVFGSFIAGDVDYHHFAHRRRMASRPMGESGWDFGYRYRKRFDVIIQTPLL